VRGCWFSQGTPSGANVSGVFYQKILTRMKKAAKKSSFNLFIQYVCRKPTFSMEG
jgi:hypothetical protein